MKQKTFFPVSQVLSLRHTKQTGKNVADTTFKPINAVVVCTPIHAETGGQKCSTHLTFLFQASNEPETWYG